MRVRGAESVAHGAREGRERVLAALRVEVMRAALDVQRGAKVRSPVRTGRLRNSIAVDPAPDGLKAKIGTNVEYAPFVEFGTRFMSAQPFLWPALVEVAPSFRERIRHAVAEALR